MVLYRNALLEIRMLTEDVQPKETLNVTFREYVVLPV